MPPTTATTLCTSPDQQHTAPFFQKPQLFILLGRVVFTVKVLSKVPLLDFTLDLSMTSCIATGQIITTYKRCNGSGEKLTIESQWWKCQIVTKLAKKWKITSSVSCFLTYSEDITVIWKLIMNYGGTAFSGYCYWVYPTSVTPCAKIQLRPGNLFPKTHLGRLCIDVNQKLWYRLHPLRLLLVGNRPVPLT